MQTNLEELSKSRVKVSAELDPKAVSVAVDRAASALGRDMSVPGFRKGKVPASFVIKKVGREVVFEQAVRDSMNGWYVEALANAGIEPVGSPEMSIDDMPPEDQPLKFSFEVGVCPTAELGQYKGVEAPRRSSEVDDEQVNSELERLQEQSASLEPVDRAADQGDFTVIDFSGTIDGEPIPGGTGKDAQLEIGGGRFIPGFEENLVGLMAGSEKTFKVNFPDDYGQEDLAGKEAEFTVQLTEVREKKLPELNDEFATTAVGFDTLEDLKEDIKTRVAAAQEQSTQQEYRGAVLDAVAEKASFELPEQLISDRAQELWQRTQQSLSSRGIPKDQYLAIVGKTEEEVIKESHTEAQRELTHESVVKAVVEAEGIDVDEAEILEAITPTAERENTKPEKLLKRIKQVGQLDPLKRDLCASKAVELLVEEAKPVPLVEEETAEV